MKDTATLETPVTTSPAISATTMPAFGNGRYSNEMARLFEESQKLLGFTAAQAEKFARQAGSDAGAVFKNTNATIKVGKANGDGKATIADASKAKGVTLTNALHVVRAIQWIGEAEKNGISWSGTKWQLSRMNDNMLKYLETL